ncbi:MAG: phosphomannomutase/phosphoglucomutase, partial [Ramlibacter sp.]
QMKARALELDAPLSGEMSGHVIFRDRWYGFDDGSYAAARLLEILSRHADAGAVLEALPASCSTPELQVRCAEGEAHRVAARLVEIADVPGAQVTSIDGLRVDWPDGFGLVRASNTTPVLVLRFEGHTPEAQARIQEEMLALLRRVKPDALLR